VSLFDISELVALEGDLSSAASRIVPGVKAVTSKGALNVKEQLQREAQGVGHAPAFPAAINYDMHAGLDSFEAEIGPVKGAAGSLALLYFGNSKTGPRLPDPMIALEAEGEKFAEHIAKAIVDGMLP
jgi:hypothetical protein